MTETDKKVPIAAAPARPGFVPDDELCGVRGVSYDDPTHVHVCTIVRTDDPRFDEHDEHACYCGRWWHS